jgi:hypothetical protein
VPIDKLDSAIDQYLTASPQPDALDAAIDQYQHNAPLSGDALDQAIQVYQGSGGWKGELSRDWTGKDEIGIPTAAKKIPFVGSMLEAATLLKVRGAAKRLTDPEFNYNEVHGSTDDQWKYDRDVDQKMVDSFVKRMDQESKDWDTFSGKVIKGIGALPTFMAEFFATGGIGAAAEGATKNAAMRVASRLAKGGIKDVASALPGKAVSYGAEVAGVVGRGLVQGSANVPMMGENYAQQSTQNALQGKIDNPYTMAAKAWGDTVIEIGTEGSGKLLRLPFGKKFIPALSKEYAKMTGGKVADITQAILEKSGYNGIIQEMGEERLGTVLRGLTGLEDFGAGEDAGPIARTMAGLKQDLTWKNQLAEAVVVGAPQAAHAGVGVIGKVFEDAKTAKFGQYMDKRITEEAAKPAPDFGAMAFKMAKSQNMSDEDAAIWAQNTQDQIVALESNEKAELSKTDSIDAEPEINPLQDAPGSTIVGSVAPQEGGISTPKWYHGSNLDLTDGQSMPDGHRGYFFTEDQQVAKKFGKNVYEADVQPKKTFDYADEASVDKMAVAILKYRDSNKDSVSQSLRSGSPTFMENNFVAWALADLGYDSNFQIEDSKKTLRVLDKSTIKSFAPTSEVEPQGTTRTAPALLPLDSVGPVPKLAVSTEMIRRAFSKIFNVPIHGKATYRMGTATSGTQAHYEPKNTVIRLRNRNDWASLAHEIGHHVDWFYNVRNPGAGPVQPQPVPGQPGVTALVFPQFPANTKNQLIGLGKALYTGGVPSGYGTPADRYAAEGIAEYFRLLIENSTSSLAAIQRDVPEFDRFVREVYFRDVPEMANAIAGAQELIKQYAEQGARMRIQSKREQQVSKLTSIESMKDWTRDLWKKFKKNFLWSFYPVEDLLKEVGIDVKTLKPIDNPMLLYSIFGNKAEAIVEHWATNKLANLTGEEITGFSKSLVEILKPVQARLKDFQDYCVAKRGLMLQRISKPGIKQPDGTIRYKSGAVEFEERDLIATIQRLESPEFKQALEEWTQWNRHPLKYMVYCGAMTMATYRKITQMHEFYVPFFTLSQDSSGRTKRVSRALGKHGIPVNRMRFEGQEQGDTYMDLIDSSLVAATNMVKVAHKTMVLHALARLVNNGWHAGAMMTPLREGPIESQLLDKTMLLEALGLTGTAAEALVQDIDAPAQIFVPAKDYKGKDNLIHIRMPGGGQQWFQVHEDLYRVLEGMDKYELPPFIDMTLGFAARLTRLGATGLSPAFAVRNLLRDAATSYIQSEHTSNWNPFQALANTMRGLGSEVLSETRGTATGKKMLDAMGVTEGAGEKFSEQYAAMGGKRATFIMSDMSGTSSLKQYVVAKTSGTKWFFYNLRHPLDIVREFIGIGEQAPRVREFQMAYAKYQKDHPNSPLNAALYAMFHAQEVTINFGRSGDIGGRWINAVVPFFNAGMQSFERTARAFKQHPLAVTIKAASILTVPALLLWQYNKDQEWWDELTDFEKYNFLHIPLSDIAPGMFPENTIIRLPTPFEFGYLFQSLPMVMADQDEKLTDWTRQAYIKFKPNTMPALLGPVADVWRNKDFTGKPIVSKSDERKLIADRYNRSTTAPMKWLGKMFGEQLGVGPSEIEYVINGWTGSAYKRTARTLDWIEKKMTPGEGRNTVLSDVPVLGSFVVRDPEMPTASIDRFYEELELLTMKNASKKITGREFARMQIMNRYARMFSPMWKQLDDPRLTPERKTKIYDAFRKVTAGIERAKQGPPVTPP